MSRLVYQSYFNSHGNELSTNRKKNNLDLVLLNKKKLAIKKSFSSVEYFMNELEALNLLSDTHGIPNLLGIDYDNLILYISFINGTSIREMLYKKGSRLLDKHPLNKNYPLLEKEY